MKIFSVMKRSFLFLSLAFGILFGMMLLPQSASAESIEFKVDARGTLTKYQGIGGDIVIPDYVKAIGDKAFVGNKEIGSVKLSKSVTKIEDSAFQGCGNLKEVIFTDSLKEIGNFAFKDCASLAKVVFPKSLETVGFAAFCNCSKLDDIYLPDTLKKIDRYAFGYYYLDQYVKIPDFVIFGNSGEAAKKYAEEFDLPFLTASKLNVKLSTVKKVASTKINVSWKQNDYVDKYEIQYATKINFSGAKSVKIAADKSLFYKKLTGLKKGKTYYIRIRGVRNVAGTTYTSSWSQIEKVKL